MKRRGKRHDGGISRECPFCYGVGARVPHDVIGGKLVFAHRRCIGIAKPQKLDPAEKYQWLTTAPNPFNRATGFDAGIKGWKLHAVECAPNAVFDDVKDIKALCGLRPVHGWGLDLFIEDECSKCLAVIERQDRTASAQKQPEMTK